MLIFSVSFQFFRMSPRRGHLGMSRKITLYSIPAFCWTYRWALGQWEIPPCWQPLATSMLQLRQGIFLPPCIPWHAPIVTNKTHGYPHLQSIPHKGVHRAAKSNLLYLYPVHDTAMRFCTTLRCFLQSLYSYNYLIKQLDIGSTRQPRSSHPHSLSSYQHFTQSQDATELNSCSLLTTVTEGYRGPWVAEMNIIREKFSALVTFLT